MTLVKYKCRSVAQLVARCYGVAEVVGSSPAAPTTISLDNTLNFYLLLTVMGIRVKQKTSYWAVATFVLVFLLVVFGRAYLINLNSSKEGAGALDSAPINTRGRCEGQLCFYEHPSLGYTLEYPSSWTGGTQETPEHSSIEYAWFSIYSPDYKLSDLSEGIPAVESGAEILVWGETTEDRTVDEYFENDIWAKAVAVNKQYTTISGQRAIQYDHGVHDYEGVAAITTIFIKNGILFRITVDHAYIEGKTEFWQDYTAVLASFRAR